MCVNPSPQVSTATILHLRSLARAERRDALEEIVIGAFKSVLLMPDDEELPLDESYFGLGFTSLRITEVKDRLEDILGCEISTNLLFSSPTVDQLMDHLVTEALADLFAVTAAGRPS